MEQATTETTTRHRRLTRQQRLFVRAFVGPARENATLAAELAGYSDPNSNGSRIRDRPLVAATIERFIRRKEGEW